MKNSFLNFLLVPQYLSDLTQMNHSAAAAYTSMAQPFGVSAHTPPHMPAVRQDSMGAYTIHSFAYIIDPLIFLKTTQNFIILNKYRYSSCNFRMIILSKG